MALVAGGDVPVGEGGSGWVGELQEGDGVPFQGLVRGVDGRSRELHGELRLEAAMVGRRPCSLVCRHSVEGEWRWRGA